MNNWAIILTLSLICNSCCVCNINNDNLQGEFRLLSFDTLATLDYYLCNFKYSDKNDTLMILIEKNDDNIDLLKCVNKNDIFLRLEQLHKIKNSDSTYIRLTNTNMYIDGKLVFSNEKSYYKIVVFKCD